MFTQKPICELTYSILALFITIKNWKLKCPSTAEWMNTLPHHHTTEHSTQQCKELDTLITWTTQMNRECILTHNSVYDILYNRQHLQETTLKSACWGWEDMLTTRQTGPEAWVMGQF